MIEIVKTTETTQDNIKYLNVNVTEEEIERKPDVVRLFANEEMCLDYAEKEKKIELQAALAMIHDYCKERDCTGCFADNDGWCELCEAKHQIITPNMWNMQRIIERMNNEGDR